MSSEDAAMEELEALRAEVKRGAGAWGERDLSQRACVQTALGILRTRLLRRFGKTSALAADSLGATCSACLGLADPEPLDIDGRVTLCKSCVFAVGQVDQIRKDRAARTVERREAPIAPEVARVVAHEGPAKTVRQLLEEVTRLLAMATDRDVELAEANGLRIAFTIPSYFADELVSVEIRKVGP